MNQFDSCPCEKGQPYELEVETLSHTELGSYITVKGVGVTGVALEYLTMEEMFEEIVGYKEDYEKFVEEYKEWTAKKEKLQVQKNALIMKINLGTDAVFIS